MANSQETINLVQSEIVEADLKILKYTVRKQVFEEILTVLTATTPPVDPVVPPPVDPVIPDPIDPGPPANGRVGLDYLANGRTTFTQSSKTLLVRTDGSDSDDGFVRPLATLAKAQSIARTDPAIEEIRIWGHAQFQGKWDLSGQGPQRPIRLKGMDPTAAIGAFLIDNKPANNLALLNLKLVNPKLLKASRGLLIEDCKMVDERIGGMNLQGAYPRAVNNPLWSNANFRFCIVAHNYKLNGTAQGIFAAALGDTIFEYCVFDGNGWDVKAGRGNNTPSAGKMVRSHNAYIQMPSDDKVIVRHCVFSRAASHGVNLRTGSQLEACLFLRNPIAWQFGFYYPADGGKPDYGVVRGVVRDNVTIGASDIAPGWPRGSHGIVAHTDDLLIENNVAAINNTTATNDDFLWFDNGTLTGIKVINNRSYGWSSKAYKNADRVTGLLAQGNQLNLTTADINNMQIVNEFLTDKWIDDLVAGGIRSSQHIKDEVIRARIAIDG